MRKIMLVFMAVLMLCSLAACGADTTTDVATTEALNDTSEIATVVIADDPIGEDAACEIAFEDAGIPATAAENLTVEMKNVNNVDAYFVAFEWSGFSYTYTIDAVGGTIIESTFD